MANSSHIYLQGRFEAGFISRKTAAKDGREQVKLRLGNLRISHARLMESESETATPESRSLRYRDRIRAVVEVVEEDSGQILESDCLIRDCQLSEVEVADVRSAAGKVRGKMQGRFQSRIGPHDMRGMSLDKIRLMTCLPGLSDGMRIKAGTRFWGKKISYFTGWAMLLMISTACLFLTYSISFIAAVPLAVVIFLSIQATFDGALAKRFRIITLYIIGALLIIAVILAIFFSEEFRRMAAEEVSKTGK